MSNHPMISIVTVCYNSEKTIAETIESVLNQNYDHYEYIIIDGLSKDATVAVAERYRNKFEEKHIPYTVLSEEDNGIYDAMNKGISMASGEIIGIINSDDYYELDALNSVASFYSKTEFDLMYADLRIFDNEKEFIKKSRTTKKFSTRFWNHPTTFVTKKVYDVQKYACQSIYDDLNFMLGVRAKGFKICILNKVLANFRLGGVSNKKSMKLAIQRVKLRNKIYKQNKCKGYRFGNFMIEFAKLILS